MPYKLIWQSDSTIWCRFFGQVDFGDVNNATNDFYNDFCSDQVIKALWDFTEMAGITVSERQASEIAATDSAASSYMKSMKAAFITGDPALAILIRQYIDEMERYGSPWSNRLFETIDEARDWIDNKIMENGLI